MDKNQLKLECSSYTTNKQMQKKYNINGQILNENDIAYPCGLLAQQYFNDTFQLFNQDTGKQIDIKTDDIAYKYDKENNYKINLELYDKYWIDVTDEHFMVWMQTNHDKNFQKLWGKIETDLDKGKYNE
ncbi:hypothetical protein PPERSA_08121 [Pseudocohnilembus persalinus]|uniref:Uncharacterized protein n=1 Tax=Pseudocohnilembus persalinus TaxID=266149 RepID=A0A0V0QLD8_PSEPJ|nr:hypothetical protein PPERSA_08121 [Pseudocohnilembus persalinus]|eukprot:KRX03046.1 hypothetical protein PPERSA_08121 [Pseudocohnilembus persalinus]